MLFLLLLLLLLLFLHLLSRFTLFPCDQLMPALLLFLQLLLLLLLMLPQGSLSLGTASKMFNCLLLCWLHKETAGSG
jgi:hypothetical protein